ncbi:MAG: flagellar biosynthesis anti-sigma factor FlgM [Deltaproteobacteria bacterium]|nr:flagellar biosynthesis anti-sigma factor FlgM [Deltaproteobacteria bacterium]
MSLKDVSQVGHLSLIDGAKKAARPEADSETEPVDKVSVSRQNPEISSAVASAQVASRADRARVVEAIAVAVRQGTYKPDPQRIAQEILEDAELIAKLKAMLNR